MNFTEETKDTSNMSENSTKRLLNHSNYTHAFRVERFKEVHNQMKDETTIFRNIIASIIEGKYICSKIFALEFNVEERGGTGNGTFHKKNSSLKRNNGDEKTHIRKHSEEHHRAAKISILRGHPHQFKAK